MRILITGAGGQLGRALQEALSFHTLIPLARADLDVTDRAAVFRAILRARPDVVIHAAAMTDVDGCARDPERAFRVNALGTQAVAMACVAAGAALVYISTNEVFDGTKGERIWSSTPRTRSTRMAAASGLGMVRLPPPPALLHRPHRLGLRAGRQPLIRKILRGADEAGSPSRGPR
jgi:nucleoside-diphosphate-sugar epimerase